jgi:chromosome segregation ATPase
MVAVASEPATAAVQPLEELRLAVSRLGQEIEKMERSLAESHRLRENLVAERGPLVVPARAGKNAAAQNRLRAIDKQLTPLRRDIADDEAALSELKEQAQSARNALYAAEWEERRAEVRELLVRRQKSETAGKIQEAARTLAALLERSREQDDRLKAEILKFSPRLS